jgi:hypothetical protein
MKPPAAPVEQPLIKLFISTTQVDAWHAVSLLVQMIRMADMWMAPDCVRKIFLALSQLRDAWQQPEVLSAVLSWLPDSSASPQYAAWDKEWKAHVTSMFQDVHAVLTNHDQLQSFRQLPFQAVHAWAASDKLVVDSENSVAVAISWWYGGDHGSRASEEQLKELSGLLRVTHLSNGKISCILT